MKSCPNCNSSFTDDSLEYCVFDRAELEVITASLVTNVTLYENEAEVLPDIIKGYQSAGRLFVSPQIDLFRLGKFERKVSKDSPKLFRQLTVGTALVFYDDSFFKSGAAGIVMTEKDIFLRDFGGSIMQSLINIRAVRIADGVLDLMFLDRTVKKTCLYGSTEKSLLLDILKDYLFGRERVENRNGGLKRGTL